MKQTNTKERQMENKTEIKKIVLQLGKKEVELTVEECKKLKEVLNEMFGRDIIKEIVKEIHHDHWNKWYWNYPQVAYLSASAPVNYNKFFYGTSSLEFKNDSLLCSIE